MEGSGRRFLTEWTTPSILTVRIGIPFVAGLYDVKPWKTKNNMIRSVGISLPNALRSLTFSVARNLLARGILLGLGYSLHFAGFKKIAAEGESAARRSVFTVAAILRSVFSVTPFLATETSDSIVAAIAPVERFSPRGEIERFAAEPQQGAGSVFLTHLARYGLVNLAASLETQLVFLAWKQVRSSESDLYRFTADASVERFGVAVRQWQVTHAACRHLGHAVGSALGAATVAAIFLGRSDSSNGSGSNDRGIIALFAGEFVGGILGIAVASGLYVKYRDVAQDAIDEETHYQLALLEMQQADREPAKKSADGK